ncbi:MAG: right-handed parallel beta-helix repeat-containing protein [Treponema sp.]|jgi:hypothetical protein|nr:right-handed parallel beta-helix repeat-containing protein [Treponema sp.]
MKKAKFIRIFASGFLAVLLAGCFNPVTPVTPKTGDSLTEPFAVDILIGQDSPARSVAGPDIARIKGDIRNIIQLIVVDKETGKLVAFDEIRRSNASETEAQLRIDSVPFGKTYSFLLLMGHWERDYGKEISGGPYVYTTAQPTLLAAGFKEQEVTGDGRMTIIMWPLVIDTVFTTADGNISPKSRTVEPAVKNGKPETVNLLPSEWKVTWTAKRGGTGNGFAELIKAQKIPNSSAGDVLLLKSKPLTIVREGTGKGTWNDANLDGNVISQSIAKYTSGFGRIGKKGSVNFKLEYVPFNLQAAKTNPWTLYNSESVFDLSGNKEPVWIIRNGVNDLAQDKNTDFTKLGKDKTMNGNGAVSFVIAVEGPKDPQNPQGGDLIIKDGVFKGPANSTTPDIAFTTAGYTGTGEVFYAVVNTGAAAPEYAAYTKTVGAVEAGRHQKQVTLPGIRAEGYDIYVLVYKGGKVSAPVVINTIQGGGEIDWIWGDEPYQKLYVKSNGLDTNTGDKEHPLATVKTALEKITSVYTSDWPNKGAADEPDAAIIILDTVKVSSPIIIDGNRGYPPIILRDDPETGNGKLQATTIKGADRPEKKNLLYLNNKARVTLDGSLILAGSGISADDARGVYVDTGSIFTINGGEISGNSITSALYSGSGVRINNGTLTMNGGKISNNTITSSCNTGGSGVYLGNGTFTMNGGEISNNATIECSGKGGGVYVNGGTFIMNDGIISGNSVTTSTYEIDPTVSTGGGGVYVSVGTFTMNGGKILDNSTTSIGGGVAIRSGTFIMTNGEILGNAASTSGGGVYIHGQDAKFVKTGGTIYGYDGASPKSSFNNKVMNSSGAVVKDKGHAVYVDTTAYRKETTMGPTINAAYHYPQKTDISGWN